MINTYGNRGALPAMYETAQQEIDKLRGMVRDLVRVLEYDRSFTMGGTGKVAFVLEHEEALATAQAYLAALSANAW